MFVLFIDGKLKPGKNAGPIGQSRIELLLLLKVTTFTY